MHRLMLDTNILMDATDRRRAKHNQALEVLRRCNGSGDKGFAASLSMKDCYYINGKIYDEAFARKAVRWLADLLIIAPVSGEECLTSLYSNEPDFEDGLIRACAELNDVDFIITNDEKAYSNSKVRALDAEAYLRIVASEEAAARELLR